jgi:CO/xanthine dehydrogenase FAD-binding subunit
MYTSEAQVWTATTLDKALQLRAEHPEATILAGGTDVMVFIEADTLRPESVLNIWPCADLKGIESIENGMRIGALSTWTEVGLCAELPAALRECAATVGAAQIQNRGTVGGNIVNASPAGDSLPLWLVLDAQFELASVRGRRMVPANEFWTGYRTTALAADELLLAVHIQWDPTDEIVYRKVGTRMAQSISKVVLGGRLRVRDGIVAEARVAMGSVAAVPTRLPSVEAALTGRPISAQAADQVHLDIQPIDDVRSTADYRVAVAARVVRSWLERAAK